MYLAGIPNSEVFAENPNGICYAPKKLTLPKPVKTDVNLHVPQVGAIAVAIVGIYIFGALKVFRSYTMGTAA